MYHSMNAIKEKKLNVLGETLWLDILKTSRALFIFLLLATIVSSGLGIAIIAPWGELVQIAQYTAFL